MVGTLTVKESSEIYTTNGEVTFAAATASVGDKFLNDGKTILIVKNLTAAPTTMTITGVGLDNYGDVTSPTVTMTGATSPGKWWIVGPFSTRHFNDATGYCKVTCSNVTSVTVAAVRLGDTLG